MRVIVLASQKGGVGKSSLAAHFAVLADRPGAPSVIVDVDPQGSLAWWHGRREAETPVLVKSSGADFNAILRDARESDIEWVIVDTPPRNEALVGTIMRRADLVVIPSRPNAFDLSAAAATIDLARAVRAPFAVLLNATPSPRAGEESAIVAEARQVLGELGASVLPVAVAQRAAVAHALIGGQAVQEFDADSRAADEIRAAWNAISALAMASQRH